VPAQLLGDCLDLAGRDPLHIHLGQRRHQRLLRALPTLEQFRRETAAPILRHPQLQRPHTRPAHAVLLPVCRLHHLFDAEMEPVGPGHPLSHYRQGDDTATRKLAGVAEQVEKGLAASS
jgi:hypothetical protein